MACVKSSNDDKRIIQLLYNEERGKKPKDITSAEAKYNIKNPTTKIEGGAVTCKFLRKVKGNGSEIFDLDDSKYYALFARGPITKNVVEKHEWKHVISNRKMNFLHVYPINDGKVKTTGYIKAHGCLMAIAWMLFAPIGIFTARYLRTFFKEEKDPEEAWFFVSFLKFY